VKARRLPALGAGVFLLSGGLIVALHTPTGTARADLAPPAASNLAPQPSSIVAMH
jgi:hypothetical protein